MTQKSQGTVSAKVLLQEAQGYRTSLESLLEIGRGLLANPSMESTVGDAFQSMTNDVLEQAGHEGDLAVVEGVIEPEARVELIMQDVLTPRLTEIEEIEQALAAKAESETLVPFTTRDAETAASMESHVHRVEMLELFQENVKNIKAFIVSNESLDVDLIRPMVKRIVERAGEGAVAFGVSLESVESTQVLGEMASAVERIEALVDKAHETASQAADAFRAEASSLGADGQDKIGDLIERHRSENPSGAVLDSNVSVNTVPKDTPNQAEAGGEEQQGADDLVNQAETDVAAAGAEGTESGGDNVDADPAAQAGTSDEADPLDSFVAEQEAQNSADDAGSADESASAGTEAGVSEDAGAAEGTDGAEEVDELDAFADNYAANNSGEDTSGADNAEEDRPLSNIGGDDNVAAAEAGDAGAAEADNGDGADLTTAEEEDELDKAAAAVAAQTEAGTGVDDADPAAVSELEENTDPTATGTDGTDAGAADGAQEGGDENGEGAEAGVATAKITTTEGEEEEEGKDKPSTESLGTPVVIENASYRIGDEGDNIRGHVLNLLTLLSHNEMLTEQGQSALQQIQSVDSKDFQLTSDMFTEKAADVLIRHYDTWIAAAFRDGSANLISIGALLDA